MARKFLYFVVGIVIVVILAAFALNIWSKELTELAFVPTAEFEEQQPLGENAYSDPGMWLSRPGMGLDDPARWQPAMQATDSSAPEDTVSTAPAPPFAVFFVHPTSFLSRNSWNAPLDDTESQNVARIYVRGLASPFNRATEIWAPRYRQATVGSFLTREPAADRAIDAAYADVREAFRFFMSSVDADTPVVLVGHSQGSLHLLRLLREELAGDAARNRVAAAYIVGWPISVAHDLPALGLPACATANQPGCILSWSSFAEPADPSALLETYRESEGFDGTLRGDSPILCTNPLTGMTGGAAPREANRGTLVPEADYSIGELVPSAVPARCDPRGLLLIGDPPELGSAVLPGNNYHVYDIPLFWKNVQDDVVARVTAWEQAR
ncbi:MAG: DUF3089 domain-containing protein [Parerythrobacter sp.]